MRQAPPKRRFTFNGLSYVTAQASHAHRLLLVGFLRALIFDPEDGSNMFLQLNIDGILPVYTALHSRR
jgi:hypothetical protein